MTVIAKASVEAQIYRWLRHDWRRYVQPGSELEKFYEEIERKYRPDQARVPAGNPDGGQWTDEGGGSSSQGDRGGASGSQGEPTAGSGRSDPRVLSDATPDNYYTPGARLAQNERSTGYPAHLGEEEQRGGHTIAEHVGKSQSYLLNRVRREAAEAERAGWADGLRAGSFTSLEAANKLVNSTLADDANKAKVDQVATGALPFAPLRKEFSSTTGYEAYARNERSQPYVRATDGVAVFIVHDATTDKGYRVHSAYPIKIGR